MITDRFVDTKTGKGTFHDTVGIIYQNIRSKYQKVNLEPLPETFINRPEDDHMHP